jgi:hypothetical protein
VDARVGDDGCDPRSPGWASATAPAATQPAAGAVAILARRAGRAPLAEAPRGPKALVRLRSSLAGLGERHAVFYRGPAKTTQLRSSLAGLGERHGY